MQHVLNFEETSLLREVRRAEVKQNYYFPNGNTISLCNSNIELIFVSLITSKTVINSEANKGRLS
ncbi:hypothetical protein [uncultured Winogradskyella sp.]|uniref:hypothetical protein n=1 Tax=uncultured Winogradskyella sp. TaxID=395353 RepID=UPI0030DC839F